MAMIMTKEEAEALAKSQRDYYPKRIGRRQWCVWCASSDHIVEFDQADIDKIIPNPS
jgi:hypothetical protein